MRTIGLILLLPALSLAQTPPSGGPGLAAHNRIERIDHHIALADKSAFWDARLKDQIQDYSRALDQINALRPVRYHYRDAGKAALH